MPNFNATADLHQTVMTNTQLWTENRPGPRRLESGKIQSDLMNRVLKKREPEQVYYSITVPLEVASGTDALHFREMQDFAKHPHFPSDALVKRFRRRLLAKPDESNSERRELGRFSVLNAVRSPEGVDRTRVRGTAVVLLAINRDRHRTD